MPTNYLKMAQECLEEATAKEARIKELWQEYRRTGRADLRRRIALIEEFREELLTKAHIYEKKAKNQSNEKEKIS